MVKSIGFSLQNERIDKEMNVIENDVSKLVFKELNNANEQFPLFHTPHEGYGVIKEEIEECMDNTSMLLETFAAAWHNIKNNTAAFDEIRQTRDLAMQLATEAIQTAAMCEKYNLSLAEDVGCCSCGVIIPEGMQVCPNCERSVSDGKQ